MLLGTFAAAETNYNDMQLTEYQELGAPLTVNAGNSKIKGGELELVAAPLEGLELSYSAYSAGRCSGAACGLALHRRYV